MKQNFLRKY